MQQAENGGEEEATVDVRFTDLPNALIACKVPEDLFQEGDLKVRANALRLYVPGSPRRSSGADPAATLCGCWMNADVKTFE